MQLANSFGQPGTGADFTAPTTSDNSFWIQEAPFGSVRQAVIHLGDCPLRDEARTNGGQDHWYGPFEDLRAARETSDQLSDVAMRAECRCVRRLLPQDPASLATLNQPLFYKPAPVPDRRAAERLAREERKAKELEARKLAREAVKQEKARKAKRAKALRYGISGVAAAVLVVTSLLLFPEVSVVQASSHPASSPFLITNDSPLPLTNLNADCSVEMQAASVQLHSSHAQLAERLGSKNQVTIPCFQGTGGTVPQTSGMTVHVTVSYAVLGIRHVQQSFSFVAARTSEGICRWVLKE